MNLSYQKPLIIGCGSWGTGLAALLSQNTTQVTMLGRGEVIDQINNDHRNSRYLPDVSLSKNIVATLDFQCAEEAVQTHLGHWPADRCDCTSCFLPGSQLTHVTSTSTRHM